MRLRFWRFVDAQLRRTSAWIYRAKLAPLREPYVLPTPQYHLLKEITLIEGTPGQRIEIEPGVTVKLPEPQPGQSGWKIYTTRP